jgi:uncharacterized protein (DUF3084 family)
MKNYREMSLSEAFDLAERAKHNAIIQKRNAKIAQKALEKAEKELEKVVKNRKKAEKERKQAEKERKQAEKERKKAMITMEESQAKTARYLLSQGTPRKTILNLFNITYTKLKSYEKTRP